MTNGGNKPKGPVKMMCSHRQFANLLIELLSFHAWYKYGNAPFGPEYQDGDADSLLTSICQMINRIISFCPRNEGNGWKLQKLHNILHLPITLVFFSHASQYDAGPGERLLKDFFKDVARRSQQWGNGVFIGQVARQMHEKMVLCRASAVTHALERIPSNDIDHATNNGNVSNSDISFPEKQAYTLHYSPDTARCTFIWNHSNKATQVHPVVLSWFGKYWHEAVGDDVNQWDCFTELKSGISISRLTQTTKTGGPGIIGPWYSLTQTTPSLISSHPGCSFSIATTMMTPAKTAASWLLYKRAIIGRVWEMMKSKWNVSTTHPCVVVGKSQVNVAPMKMKGRQTSPSYTASLLNHSSTM
jgi:hypothetical protein